jgi:hypothetical protein
MRGKSTGFFTSLVKAWSFPIVALMALTVSGCSGGGDSPKAEKLCEGAVSPAAETSLENMTGTSPLSSVMGSASYTPDELRKRALEWTTEEGPWESSSKRWFCSVGDQDAEKSVGIGSSWSLVEFSYAEKEIQKGSGKYVRISPGAILEKRRFSGRTYVYFPCQVAEASKRTAMYTLEVDLATDIATAVDTQADVNKVMLSVARWISSEVGCVNKPDIPSSAPSA